MEIVSLIIQLLSGAAGGNLAGNVAEDANLGPLGNTIAGAIGGGLGDEILSGLRASRQPAAAAWISEACWPDHRRWGQRRRAHRDRGYGPRGDGEVAIPVLPRPYGPRRGRRFRQTVRRCPVTSTCRFSHVAAASAVANSLLC